ncbi:MAG: DNA-packaging protein [Oscillospiraceae bacterium]|nr:DNA-packaging protein [Oscillospiraceae bacterium]
MNGRDFPCGAKALAGWLDAYFDECEAGGRKPTVNGLCLAAGITPAKMLSLLRAYDSGETPPDFPEAQVRVLKTGQMRLCDYLEQQSDSMSILKAKQPCYCGYSDRPASSGGDGAVRVVLRMDGANPGE